LTRAYTASTRSPTVRTVRNSSARSFGGLPPQAVEEVYGVDASISRSSFKRASGVNPARLNLE